MRGKSPEELTEEEEQWLQLDKILSPHVFDANELAAVDDAGTGRSFADDLVSSILPGPIPGVLPIKPYVSSLESTSGLSELQEPNASIAGSLGSKLPLEGDKYQMLRDQYELGEQVFGDRWICPFNRKELLELRRVDRRGSFTISSSSTSSSVIDTEDAKRCRELMEKYYVGDDESIQGHMRLAALHQLSSDLLVVLSDETVESDSISITSEDHTKTNTTTKRIWGSWDCVHPASAGLRSQTHTFMPFAFNASRDHPASYAVTREENVQDEDSDDDDMETTSMILTTSDLRRLGRKALTSLPNAPNNNDMIRNARSSMTSQQIRMKNSIKSKYFIAEDIKELGRQDPQKLEKKIILLVASTPRTLLEVKDYALQPRQSKSLRFDITDKEVCNILMILSKNQMKVFCMFKLSYISSNHYK